jgi:hypothetical protein
MTGIPRKLVELKFIDRRVSSLGDRTVATSSLVRSQILNDTSQNR